MTTPSNTPPSTRIPAASGFPEAALRGLLRAFYWLSIRVVMGPPWPFWFQRGMLALLAAGIPGARGVRRRSRTVDAITVEIIDPPLLSNPAVLLYLHGGAFTLGCPQTHRAITTRLAVRTGSRVWVPHYRRAPEAPYPAALDDCLACYRSLLTDGVPARQIVVAGDSAGGGLTLALALRLKQAGLPQPAGLMVISPVTDSHIDSESGRRYRHSDALLRPSFLHAGLHHYQLPAHSAHHVLQHDLAGLPPLLIHVGTDEMLYDHSLRLAEHARACGVAVDLVIYERLWHVLHLSAPFLATADAALNELAQRHIALTRV